MTDKRDYIKLGIAKAAKGDVQGAIAELDRAIEVDPGNAVAYANRGAAKILAGNPQGAIADLDKAIEINPGDAAAYGERGNAKARKGDLDGAIEDFTKVIEIDPADAAAYGERGNAKARKGDLASAIKDFTEAIEIEPAEAEAHYSRGIAKQNRKDLNGAIADFTQATGIEPGHASAYYSRGIARKDMDELDGAMIDLSKAIRLEPAYALLHNERGLVQAEKSNWKGAVADCSRAIDIDPGFASAYYNRSTARKNLQDWEGVIADCSKAIELDPGFAAAYNSRGEARAGTGDLEGAIADFSRAIEIMPGLAEAHYNLSIAKGSQGKSQADDSGARLRQTNLRLYLELVNSIEDKGDQRHFLEIGDDICSLLTGNSQPPAASDKPVMHYTSLDVGAVLCTGARYHFHAAAGMPDALEGNAILDVVDDEHKAMYAAIMGRETGAKTLVGSFVTDSKPTTGDEMMWQAYGRQSTGCALVFERRKFADIQEGRYINAPVDETMGSLYVPRQECQLLPVVYLSRGKHREMLEDIIKRIHAKSGRYPRQARLLLDFIRFHLKSERYERESEARTVVWRRHALAHDASGEYPRPYIECYKEFRPGRILLGPGVEKPGLWKEFLCQQLEERRLEIDVEVAA